MGCSMPRVGETPAAPEAEALAEPTGDGTGVPNGAGEGEAAARKRGATKLNAAAETIVLRVMFVFMRYQLVMRSRKEPFKISDLKIR